MRHLGAVSISTTDRPTGPWTILLWTYNMGGWSVARSDGTSCLLKQPPGFEIFTPPVVSPKPLWLILLFHFKKPLQCTDQQFTYLPLTIPGYSTSNSVKTCSSVNLEHLLKHYVFYIYTLMNFSCIILLGSTLTQITM